MKKTAIILFNLGGPDRPDSVKPFLFNLFSDSAIIGVPQPLRYLIAKLISSRRAPIARAIYARIGGGSPILKNTQDQARALEKYLNAQTRTEIHKVFIAMRYWHPFADQTAREVKEFAPDEMILLPLYPQFSTTTTGSSVKDWHRAARKMQIDVPAKTVCCYPQQEGFIRALSSSIRAAYAEAQKHGKPRILFSAHGLPEKIVKAGDPYQWQCEQTVAALRQKLKIDHFDNSILCFQSRVGPLKWIGPSTDDEIRRAGEDGVPIVIVPIAFVSEHSETLVELDIEYRDLARQSGAPFYIRVPAVATAPDFIHGLAALARAAQDQKTSCASATGEIICPAAATGCLCRG